MSVPSLPLHVPKQMFIAQCSAITYEHDSIVFSAQKKTFVYALTLCVSIFFHILYSVIFVDSRRTNTYTILSLCNGITISNSLPTRVIGLPNKLPKFVFISAHHNFRISKHHIIPPAFLTNYDRIYTITSLHFKVGFFDISSIVRFLIGAIDLKNKKDKYYDILEPMQKSLMDNASCAVIVYSTRSGSGYFGDRTMCMRKGIFTASLALQVPIMDVFSIEPTPSCLETTVNISMYVPPTMERETFSTEYYRVWRQNNSNIIDKYNMNVQDSYIAKLSSIEDSKASCALDDDNGVCHEWENSRALISQKEVMEFKKNAVN